MRMSRCEPSAISATSCSLRAALPITVYGGRGSVDSSSFDNIAVRFFGGPAIEYNLFPYSQYTRRQLRFGYAIGPYRARYTEETLFFKLSDTLVQQQASVTIDQREPWGSLQAELEYQTFLPQLRYRTQGGGRITSPADYPVD